MDRSLRKATTGGLLLLCLLIAGNGILSYRNLGRLLVDSRRAERAHEALSAIQGILDLSQGTLMAAREFVLIDGADSLLERDNARGLQDRLAAAAPLFSELPEQRQRLDLLQRQVTEVVEFSDDLVRTRQEQSKAVALKKMTTGSGAAAMEQLRRNVAEIRNSQKLLVAEWAERSDNNNRTALISIINATLGALLLLGAVHFLARRDRAETSHTEAILRAGEARFRRLVDANVMGVLFANFDGRVSDANDAFLNMIGYSRADLDAGRVNWRKMTPSEFTPSDDRAIEELKSRGVSAPVEKEFFRQDGTRVPCLLACARLDQPADLCICYAIDLTDRKKSEATIQRLNRELQDRVHELETLFELMPIGLGLAKDAECREISINSEYARLLGLPARDESSLTATWSQRPDPFRVLQDGREVAREERPMYQVAATGKPILNAEYEVVRPDGSSIKLLEYVAPLFDDEGRSRGCVGAFIDVTERKRLEDQLKAHADHLQNEQHWLESMLDLLPVPLLLIEPATATAIFANRAANEMAGGQFPLGEPAERYDRIYHFTDPHGTQITAEQMPGVRVAGGERLDGIEINWHLPNGARTIMISADTLPSTNGHGAMAVLLFQDITRLKQIQRELKRNNQAKDALLAMLGHELRNPLAAIAGSAELIAMTRPEDSSYQQSLGILRRQIQHLTRLVDDMLDLARLTARKVRLRLECLDLGQVLVGTVQTFQPLVLKRQHLLNVETPAEPVFVRGDRVRLEQIFTNLLENAAKYTDPGGRITLSVAAEEGRAVVRVRDNGIGLDPDAIPTLFDLFAQVNPQLDRSEVGLGIGLTVVRDLVRLHGGEISAHSEGLGKGSEFVVELPLTDGPREEDALPNKTASDTAASSRVLRVLVVEDQPDIGRVMRALIERAGHQPHWAATGQEALELAEATLPDVAFIDIGLPGMNGFELARRIRANPRLEAMSLIALTGYGQQEDRAQSHDAGFARHLVKPIDAETLTMILRERALGPLRAEPVLAPSINASVNADSEGADSEGAHSEGVNESPADFN